ncbi:MAG: RNase H family protein [Propionibacteriaceae bacterium]
MITAAADGSSLSNPGPAGWAWYIDETCWAAGGWQHGTNNMGELMAVLDILRQTRDLNEPLLLLCDSQYAINVCSKWLLGWKRRGWKKADGKPILNLELIQELDRELAGRDITFEWVKGHAGHDLNEAADQRARAAATAFRDGTPLATGPGFGRVPIAARTDFSPTTGTEPEPDLFAAPALSDIEQVVLHERELLADRIRQDRHAAAELLHPDFVEFGMSGRVWTRAAMLDKIGPLIEIPEVETLSCQKLDADTILHTWKGHTSSGVANRSSLWLRTSRGWQLRFHQGTAAF